MGGMKMRLTQGGWEPWSSDAERKAVGGQTTNILILSVACPRCRAVPGDECNVRGGAARFHAPRIDKGLAMGRALHAECCRVADRDGYRSGRDWERVYQTEAARLGCRGFCR